MSELTDVQLSVRAVHRRRPDFTPRIGIILGTDFNSFIEAIADPTLIAYSRLPGFQQSSKTALTPNLYLGLIENIPIACIQGHGYFYEGVEKQSIKNHVRTLKLLGCEILILANSAKALRNDIALGSLVMIKDHINLQFRNPLVGSNDESFGPRFVSMDHAYDLELQMEMRKVAQEQQLELAEGVYLATLGPSFETPAEVKTFRLLGADLIGMSMVAEVIVARHCGMRVAAIGVTDRVAGSEIADEEKWGLGVQNLFILLRNFIVRLGSKS